MADLQKWPSSLGAPLRQGSTWVPTRSNVVWSEMDAADKGRRRFTSTTEDVTFAMLLPASGVQVLLDFFSITLREVHRFEWVDFRDPSRRPAIYQFKQRPSISDETPWLFRASLQLKLFSQLNGKFLLSDENRSVLIDVDNNGLTT